MLAKVVDRELGRVENMIRGGAYRRKQRALLGNGFHDSLARVQWMRPSRLAESANDCRILGLEKPQGGGHTRLIAQFRIHSGEFVEALPFTHVDSQGDLRAFPFRFQREFVKLSEKFDGKVVDAEVAAIFQGLEECPFAGPAEASHDDERCWVHVFPYDRLRR